MTSRTLLDRLVYLDRGYIADLYEVVTGESPNTQITKNQGKKAGAQIPIFSAEVSAQETRLFPVSTLAMLSTTLAVLEGEARLESKSFQSGMRSKYGWMQGELTVFEIKSSRQEHSGEYTALSSDQFFHLRTAEDSDVALITTPEYFSSGLSALLRMQNTLLKEMSLPVRAFIRTVAAQSYLSQWIGVPLVVLEHEDGA